MQPYQQSSAEVRRRNLSPQNALKTGLDLTSQMMPLLSQYVPPLLALKGMSTLNSGIGKFIGAARAAGQQPEQIVDFIRNKVSPPQDEQQQSTDQQERAPEQQNIIQRLAPTLYQDLKNMIDKGINPLQAAAKMKNDRGSVGATVRGIEKEAKADWLSIVESIFGKGDMAQPQQQQRQPQQEQQPQQQAQGGQGQQALMQMLQKINQRMGPR